MLADFDEEMREKFASVLAGVDEAGRGPWAGPVVTACVILSSKCAILHDINDSKKLSQKKREELFLKIQKEAEDFSICVVDEKIIDKINILEATRQGFKRSVLCLNKKPGMILVDGISSVPDITIKQLCIPQGDGKSACIAAASILAKVTRDNIMQSMDKLYPGYEFGKHKGYGTALHYKLIKEMGALPIHRKSYKPIQEIIFNEQS
ncbi:MAG: ribonuclease HII [Elusimicrobiota bacterium]